ncbi:MAG: hypothetical protein EZS28_036381, partial [Streblomastix strix]
MRTFISLFPDDVSKYVRRWITIGTPFQGASRITVALLFGYNFNLPTFLVSPRLMQTMQRTIPLTFWFLPPKNCPFSPKVAIQYSGQREITWYGFHNDQDNKCWDYDIQQQEIQITPMEYINMPMFAPCPLHSLFRPGFALAGYKQDRHIELRKKKNQRTNANPDCYSKYLNGNDVDGGRFVLNQLRNDDEKV